MNRLKTFKDNKEVQKKPNGTITYGVQGELPEYIVDAIEKVNNPYKNYNYSSLIEYYNEQANREQELIKLQSDYKL